MRKSTAVALAACVLAIGCSSKKAAKDDGSVGSEPLKPQEAGPIADAPPLAACTTTHGTNISVHQIGQVTNTATLATSPVNDGRLFVLEEPGRIRIFENETLVATPFLDISNLIESGNDEQGLLGLAFDPNYATNRQFYVYFTADNPDTNDTGHPYVDVVYRFQQTGANPDIADPASATLVLSIPDPFVNHNGGMIEFGPDGYLYISIGDGGSGGDPQRNAQNPMVLLGKMMRIDVDHPANGKPYGIPADNPYASGVSGAPEVFMIGLRNPWRWSFDRATGDMWIGDVGQDVVEELDVLKAGTQLGANLGWSAYEANTCCAMQTGNCEQGTGPFQPCTTAGKFFPQITKTHSGDGWNAIIGGQVYRGACYPDIVGTYFFTDNGHSGLSEGILNADGSVTETDLPGTWPLSPASIHADARGELYETTTGGEVYHIEAGP